MNMYKENYKAARKEAFNTGKLDKIGQNSGVFTTKMLSALREMAEHDVYPDGSFGDEECVVWSMFR